VLLHKEFTILNFGGGYVTEPVALVPGSYRITEFMLVNDSSVLYATPLAGSPLAKAVNHALPYTFGVQANKVSNIDMQVLSVAEYTPEQFGYASFHATIVNPLPIAVFAMGNTPSLTSSTVYILNNNDTLYTKALGATAGFLPFTLDPAGTYTMIVFKEGYASLKRTFVYNDVIAELQGSVFNVYLNPALTAKLVFTGDALSRSFNFTLEANGSASLTIDWGDGSIEPFTATDFDVASHQYPDNSNNDYYVTVTGELTKITQFGDGSIDGGEVTDINFDHVSALTDIWLYSLTTNHLILDIRKNSKIQHFVFGGAGVLLPASHQLRSVVLFNTALASSLDAVIHNVHQNTIAKNITGGEFFYATNPDGGVDPLGTPSIESQNQLQELQYGYSWNVQPN
jgi:hypothetical protein